MLANCVLTSSASTSLCTLFKLTLIPSSFFDLLLGNLVVVDDPGLLRWHRTLHLSWMDDGRVRQCSCRILALWIPSVLHAQQVPDWVTWPEEKTSWSRHHLPCLLHLLHRTVTNSTSNRQSNVNFRAAFMFMYILDEDDFDLDLMGDDLLNIVFYALCEILPSICVLVILRRLPPKRSKSMSAAYVTINEPQD